MKSFGLLGHKLAPWTLSERILGQTFLEHLWTCLETNWDFFGKFWEHFWDDLGGKMENFDQILFYQLKHISVPEIIFN